MVPNLEVGLFSLAPDGSIRLVGRTSNGRVVEVVRAQLAHEQAQRLLKLTGPAGLVSSSRRDEHPDPAA